MILEDALTPDEVAYYRDAVDRVCASDPEYVEGTTDHRVSNAAPRRTGCSRPSCRCV